MKYISVAETAKRWGVSERSVRGYCAEGKIDGAFLTGKTWNIPETAEKPDRMNKKTDAPKTLLEVLKAEKAAKLHLAADFFSCFIVADSFQLARFEGYVVESKEKIVLAFAFT